MAFLFGADSKDKKDYDSSFKFKNQNVSVSKSKDAGAGAGADIYDLNFGVEIPVFNITVYLKNLKDLGVKIFNIFGQITAAAPATNDTLKKIISILKELLSVIQNIHDMFNAYTYSNSNIEAYMTVTVLNTLKMKLQEIHIYISKNESKISPNTNFTISNSIKSEVTKIIQLTYAAAGAVAVASSDNNIIATETNVKTIYDNVTKLPLTNEKEAANFIDTVLKSFNTIITTLITHSRTPPPVAFKNIDKLYAAISKKSEYLDFYFNNKINLKLIFDKDKINIDKSGPGTQEKSSCLLTQYVMKSVSDESAKTIEENNTQGISISTQARIQTAINAVKSEPNPNPTAENYHDKFITDKVFVDMDKDNSKLVSSTLPTTKSEKNTLSFEFDLNEFKFDTTTNTVSPHTAEQSGSPTKNLLLLRKGNWISIVFTNVHIPLKQTPSDGIINPNALTLILSIDNNNDFLAKTAGLAASEDMTPFTNNFFPNFTPIVFGTKNRSALTFQKVKVSSEELKKMKGNKFFDKVKQFKKGLSGVADLARRKQSFLIKTNSIVDAFRKLYCRW